MGDQKTQQTTEHATKAHEKDAVKSAHAVETTAHSTDTHILSRLSSAGSLPPVLGTGLSHPTAAAHQAAMLRTLQRRQGNAFVQQAVVQGRSPEGISDHAVEQAQSDQSSGQSLDSSLQTDMEDRFGQDFSGVRLHTDTRAADLAKGIHAQAFTRRQDIYFGSGQYQPSTRQGQHLLAHELVHVIQQKQFVSASNQTISKASDLAEVEATSLSERLMRLKEPSDIHVNETPIALMRQDDAGAPASSPSPQSPVSESSSIAPASTTTTSTLSPNLIKQLTYTATVLRRIQPLPKEQEDRLNQIIGDTPVYEMIQKRNEKREQIIQDQQILEEYQHRNEAVARGEQLAGGAPAPQDVLDHLTNEIATLTSEVEQLDKDIQETLKGLNVSRQEKMGQSLGVSTEADVLHEVEIEFPELWINRAKQITYTMLDENRDRVQHEKDRYPANISSVDIEGLRDADEHLNTLATELHDVSQKAERVGPGNPPGGVPESEDTDYNVLEKRVKAKQEELARQRQIYGTKYPMLLLPKYIPGSFVNASPEELEMLTGGWLQEILDNIETTRQNIAHDKIKVWNLRDVPSLTFQSLDVAEDSIFGKAVKKYIQGKESDEASLNLAEGVLQVGLVLLATAVAGPLGGALVGSVLTLDQLSEHIDQYMAESGASQVAIDPIFADISVNEPQLLPIVLDIISLGLDVGAVMGALRPAARTLAATGDIDEFAAQARRRFPPDEAEQLIDKVSRRFGATGTGRLPGPYTILISDAEEGVLSVEELTKTLVKNHPRLEALKDSLRAINATLEADASIAADADTIFVKVIGPDGSAFTRARVRYNPNKATLAHLYHELNHLQDFGANRIPPTHVFSVADAGEFQRLQRENLPTILDEAQRVGTRLLQSTVFEAAQYQVRRAIAEIRNTLRDIEEFAMESVEGKLKIRPGMEMFQEDHVRIIRKWQSQIQALLSQGRVLGEKEVINEVERQALEEYMRTFVRESFPELPGEFRTFYGGDFWGSLTVSR